jgi:hypothetical protein
VPDQLRGVRSFAPATFLVSAVLLFGFACGESAPPEGPEPVFLTYTTADGLASNDVAALEPFPFNRSDLAAVDHEGNISYYPTYGIPEAPRLPWGNHTRPDSISGISSLQFGLDSGYGVYLSFLNGGFVRFKQGKWEAIPTPFNQASALAPGKDETLWSSGVDQFGYNGLWHFADDSWESVLNAGRDFYFATITDIISTGDGELWLATWGTGLINYKNGSSRLIQTGDGLPSDFINRIRFDEETGGLWLVTPEGFHLIVVDEVSAPFDNAYLADKLAFDLAVDSEGRHWFATRSDGVLMYSAGIWTEFTEEHGLGSNYVTAITTLYEGSQEGVWFGTRNGVSRYIGD